jgi:membrane fusion protein, copper/silver efflux system
MNIKLEKKEIRLITISVIIGLIIGWMFFYTGEITKSHNHEETADVETIWTCSMHPQIKMSEPGLCPICAMDLVPIGLVTSSEEYDVQISESAVQLANIQTTLVKKKQPEKSIQLFGTVQPDDRNISQITARFNGRIEDLQINFIGQNVKKGQIIGSIYSPELISAQKELLQAVKSKTSNPAFYNSIRNKLKLWNLTDAQIEAIENKGNPKFSMEMVSSVNGSVILKNISIGDYVKEGSVLFEVTDLSKLWIQFEVYEEDLPWININDEIEFTIQSFPGKKHSGKVKFLDPWINENTRVAKIRVEVNNPNQNLKPGMYANGLLNSSSQSNSDKLIIPKTAVLWTGKRSVVFVKVPDLNIPSFAYREIILGVYTNDGYVVEEGLIEGEEIVTNGVFKVDAASQLIGNASMMNPRNDINFTGMQSNLKKESFKVFGNCAMCEDRIETAVNSLMGIKKADWNRDTKLIEIIFNPDKIKLKTVHKIIAEVGHDTELEEANKSVYDELPACCEYRN